jgi:VWFA-related protein
MLNRSFAGFGLLLLATAAAWPAFAQQVVGTVPEDGSPIPFETEPQAGALPTFRDELDVSLINLFVTVVDSKGAPVPGLVMEDFEVFEEGAPMTITNFEAIDRRELVAVDAEVEEDAGVAAALAEVPKGRYLALLFDNQSLERRTRRHVLKSLESFIDDELEQNGTFLIALNTGSLEIVKPFTANGPGLKAALRGVAEMPSSGDALKKSKRYLKRTVYNEEIYRTSQGSGGSIAGDGGGGTMASSSFAIASAQRLLTEINSMRRIEYERIRQSLRVTDELLRAVAGIEGRKTVVWVGEDLAMRPMLDVYNVWFSRTQPLASMMTVIEPALWGEELKLDREFEALAASAQASGATFYIIDASDRDRELATADYSPPSAISVFMAESTGGGAWTPGANLAELRDLTEGAEYVALATGGSMFGNTRDVDRVLDTLADQVSTYYYLGYRRDGPPDGRRHDIKVRVRGDGLRVRHHEQVLDRTEPQRLADLAVARLRLDIGANDLGLAVSLEAPEPAEDKRYVQPIQLAMPVDRLVLVPDADRHIGQILVAVAVLDGEGNTAPAHLVRLRLTIPSERYSEGAVAVQRIRLLMREGTRRIAVSVRDEVSGIEASQAITLGGEVAGAGS